MTNSQKYLSIFFIAVGVMAAGSVAATSEADIAFPIPELGGCETEQSCKAYCDDPAHVNECLAFAEQHNLIPPEELSKMKKFRELGVAGPGGCQSEFECRTYCENIQNMQECLAFAEQHGLMSRAELQEAKKVANALAQGHQLPGGCQGMVECESYCQSPDHMEECVEFGIAAGLIPPEEADIARRVAPLMAQGRMPGGCSSQETCEAYCSDSSHVEECSAFFVEIGVMSPEDADIFRKTGGKGPGGCQGRECEDFCNDPANQETCFEFAREHGLISEGDLREMKEGLRRMQEGLRDAPPEVAQCLRETIGEDVLQKIEAGTFTPNARVGDHMRQCFERFFKEQGPPEGEGPQHGNVPPEQQACIERILGEGGFGPPSPEDEERIGRECFGGGQENFGPPPGAGEFERQAPSPERFEEYVPDEFRQQFEGQFQEEFERRQEFHETPPEQFLQENAPGSAATVVQLLLRLVR